MAAPKLGEDGVVSESQPLSDNLLPREVGLRKLPVVYSCLDASLQYLVVGSAQGYVFVVDVKAMTLLKEFNELKGTAVTAVKLNPVKDCVAYATDNGYVRVERVTRTVSTKWRAQEKSHASVTCLEWSPSGENLYVGFATGRVIQFHLQYPDGAFSPVSLPDNYGSQVVQLSASNQALLVSTEERALLVDVNTYKLDQVGRKDRKAGPFGGFFVQDGSRSYVARPGLRLWVADSMGKVSHTVAFKEALSTRHLPAVNIKTMTSLPPHFSKSWQFSSLHSWISDRFILTFHNNTLFILDPEEGNIVGVLTLQYSIMSLATSGGHLFVLCNPGSSRSIIKLSLHPSFVKLKSAAFLKVSSFVGNLSTTSSRSSSRDALDQLHITEKSEVQVSPKKEKKVLTDGGGGEVKEGTAIEDKRKPVEELAAEVEGGETLNRDVVRKQSPVVPDETVETDGVGSKDSQGEVETAVVEDRAGDQDRKVETKELNDDTNLQGEAENDHFTRETDLVAAAVKQDNVESETEKQVIDTPQESAQVDSLLPEPRVSDETSTNKSTQAEIDASPTIKKELESEKESGSIPEHSRGKSLIPTLALVQGISHVKADLKEIKGALKLDKLTEFISQATSHSPTPTRKSEHVSFSVSSNEVVRLPGDGLPGDKDVPPTPTIAPTSIDPEEQRRRLRMAEMVEQDEDIVVASKSPSKPKKSRKRKTKKSSKHSSAASSKSVSMEQLYEPDYNDEVQRENDVISKFKGTVPLPSLELSEQQEAELSALEQAQQAAAIEQAWRQAAMEQAQEEAKLSTSEQALDQPEASSEKMEGEAEVSVLDQPEQRGLSVPAEVQHKGDVGNGPAPSLDELGEEETKLDAQEVKGEVDIDGGVEVGVVAESAVLSVAKPSTETDEFEEECAQSAVQEITIEQESGQEIMGEEVGGATYQPAEDQEEQSICENVKPHPLDLADKQEVGGDLPTTRNAPPPSDLPLNKKEPSAYKPLFDEASDQEDALFGNSDSSLPLHSIGSITRSSERDHSTPDYSNPLYQDSDSEEQRERSGSYDTTGREWLVEAAEFGHARRSDYAASGSKGSFLSLQPVAIDPLRSDEYDDLHASGVPYGITPSLDHTLAHVRYSSSPEQPTRVQPQSLPCSSDMITTGSSPPKFSKTTTASPVMSKFTARRHVNDNDDEKSDGSDSSRESDNEATMGDSQVVTDWYQLCGGLVQDSRKSLEQRAHLKPLPTSSPPKDKTTFEPVRRRRIERVERSLDEEEDSSPNADIWVPIPHPSRHNLQSMSLSEKLLWVVDTRGNVYCTTMESRGRDWHNIKRSMSQISSSPSGNNVWGIYRHNAYVRHGIGMNPEGSQWRNITKNTHLAHKIKQIAVDETAVWAISTDGKVLFRKDVGESSPEGKVWQEVTHGASGFSFITCCQGIVWAITSSGKVFCRTGITPSIPCGRKWADVKSPKFVSVSITTGGVIWGVSQDNSIGFRCGVSLSRPTGKGPWWEVCVNALNTPSSPFSPLWHVMSHDGNSILTSVSSFVTTNLPTLPGLPGLGVNKVLSISASSHSGVVVLETGSRLHACWRSTTGFHYSPACKEDIFQFMSWSKLAAGGSALWLVRADNGDLYSLAFGETLKRIECPAKVDLLAASPSCMWIVSKDSIWSRQALTTEVPEGISFDYIELSTQLHDTKLRDVSCGKRSVWAVDTNGIPHFRFGVHAREPGTGMSPAWVPVEDNPQPLLKIAVSPDDWLVWACDENFNVYVRTGVTTDFPVGRRWELIPGERVKELCASNEKVYALSQSGELLCRYGITETNVQGNYWRKMPGKYKHISVGEFGDLWTMDAKGQVWKQEWKVMTVGSQLVQGKEDLETGVMMEPSDWEML